MILLADSEGPDQTARMRSPIWAFAVRICPNTYFRNPRPKWSGHSVFVYMIEAISLYWNPYVFISNWSQRQPLLLCFIHSTGNDVTKIYRKDQFLRLHTIHMYSFPLTLSMMGKNYIRRHFKTFEYFFPEKVALRNFMQKETIFMKCQILFSGKNKKT